MALPPGSTSRRESDAAHGDPSLTPETAPAANVAPAGEASVGSNRRHLAIVLGVALVALAVDVAAAWLSGSLALIADAAHRVTDVIGISIAFGAATVAARPATQHRSFGYARAEVMAACVNAGLLIALGVFIAYEALARFIEPQVPEPGPMLFAAVVGLVGSGTAALIMRSEHEGFAARGAFLDVLGDAVGSIAAILAALVVIATGWPYADAIASLAVVILVVPRALLLLRDAMHVLMESTPYGLSLPAVRGRILAVPGVVGVHDLHAWQITAGLPMITAHVIAGEGEDHHRILHEVDACLGEDFDLDHSTIQVEHVSRPLEADAHA
jgi:cobalt-zinc-cadmium efflux system protein